MLPDGGTLEMISSVLPPNDYTHIMNTYLPYLNDILELEGDKYLL